MILQRLRTETRPLHEQTEQESLAKYIMSHQISLEQYSLLMYQNYLGYLKLENAIYPALNASFQKDFNLEGLPKTQLIAQDLDALQIDKKDERPDLTAPVLVNEEAAIGAWYVLEGSMLGAMVIHKQLLLCPALHEVGGFHFYHDDQASTAARWRQFRQAIQECTFTEAQENAIVAGANDAFLFIGEVARKVQTYPTHNDISSLAS